MRNAEDSNLEPSGLAGLADERGGGYPNKQHVVTYAVVVPTVAQLLGDSEAGIHLLNLNKSNDEPTLFLD
ncbi:hypothetical protein ACFFLM_04075 [Deinococcus oregonensis]|uniref:Uncharacterized protein n=1 Tax=Deinococcus oregonensis TaxID=1805970 RepID=A0ABV6AVW7_9DEIO